MKYYFLITPLCIFLFIAFVPLSGLALSESDAYTYFSMGYYYLYNNELEMAKNQFELCLYHEKEPAPVIYTILAEICDMLGQRHEAEEYTDRALERNPENETALKYKALFLIDRQEYEEALPYLIKLQEIDPNDVKFQFYIAEIYNELGDEENLIEVYKNILTLKPDNVDVRLNLGYLFTKNGRLEEAKKEYERVLKNEPENEKALFYLAYLYLNEGNTSEAIKQFELLDTKDLLNDEMLEDYAENLFINNKDPVPVITRVENKENMRKVTKAILRFCEGDYESAKTLFEETISEDPDSIASYKGLIRIAEKKNNIDMEQKWRFVLAGCYYRLRQLDRAREEAVRVKEIEPAFLENRYLLGDINTSLGKVKEAIEEYTYFEAHAEEKGDIYVKLGLSYDELGDHESAIRNFISATELYPENDEVYYYLGIEYRIVKDYRRAADAFQRAVQLKDDNAYYYFNLGVCYERLGLYDEAIFYLDKSVQLDSSNASALNYLGYILADKGIRLLEAKELIEKALSMDPENGAYLDSIGWVHFRLENFERAKEYFETAVQYMDENDAENYLIYDHLGDTYIKIGLFEEAIAAWKKALEMKTVEEIERKIDRVQKERRGK
jgi:tetratricopeptide (TPR) repeat protein